MVWYPNWKVKREQNDIKITQIHLHSAENLEMFSTRFRHQAIRHLVVNSQTTPTDLLIPKCRAYCVPPTFIGEKPALKSNDTSVWRRLIFKWITFIIEWISNKKELKVCLVDYKSSFVRWFRKLVSTLTDLKQNIEIYRQTSRKAQLPTIGLLVWCKSGPCLNIKTVFPRYEDSHVKGKTVTGPSYL